MRGRGLKRGCEMGLAGPVIDWDGVEELGAIGADPTSGRHDDDAITVFKSIGVGLEDVA